MLTDPNPYASPAPTPRDDRPPRLGDAELLAAEWLYRRVRLADESGAVIEYNARGIGYDRVRVNGRTAAWHWKWWWFVPRFDFVVPGVAGGPARHGVLKVQAATTLKIVSLTIEVDDELVYGEQMA